MSIQHPHKEAGPEFHKINFQSMEKAVYILLTFSFHCIDLKAKGVWSVTEIR